MSPIETITLNFANDWNNLTKYLRAYQLDYSWPSVSVLDHILRPIADKLQDLTQTDIHTINCCAGYIANILVYTWLQFPEEPVVSVTLQSTAKLSVIITAKDKSTDALLFELNLSQTILTTLQDKEQPFRFFPLTERYLPDLYPRIALLATALLLGSHRQALGSWAAPDAVLDDAKRITINAILAKSTAHHYSIRFPEEKVGAQHQFFEGDFLFPPAAHLEPFPYTRSTIAAIQRLIQQVSSEEEIIAFAQNATRTGDDILAHVGLAILAAVMKEPDAHLLLNIQARRDYATILCPAINMAKQCLGKNFSWFNFATIAQKNDDGAHFEIAEQLLADDFNLGLIPHLRLTSDFVRNEAGLFVINAIFFGRYEEAIKVLEAMISSDKNADDRLRIQLSYLQLLLDRPTMAQSTLQNVTSIELFAYKECQSLLLNKFQDIEIALPFMEALLEEAPAGVISQNISRLVLAHYLRIKDYEKVIHISDMLLSKGIDLQAMLAKVDALRETNQRTSADEILGFLRKTVPYHWDVFASSLQ